MFKTFNNNEVNSSEIVFEAGNELEIYFPEEKTEYRLPFWIFLGFLIIT